MKIFLILPTQLFETNNYLKDMDRIIMVEDFLTNQHKQKLVLHRASMKYYYNKLKTVKMRFICLIQLTIL